MARKDDINLKGLRQMFLSMIVMPILLTNTMYIPAFAAQEQSYYISNKPFYIFDGSEYSQITTYDVVFNNEKTTCIFTKELINYGYDVKWDPAKRETRVSYSGTLPKSVVTLQVNHSDTVFKSDIKIYIDGNFVPSFNIGGYSLIPKDVIQYGYNGFLPSKWAMKFFEEAWLNDIRYFERLNQTGINSNYFKNEIRADEMASLALQFVKKKNTSIAEEMTRFQDHYSQSFTLAKQIGIFNGLNDKTIIQNSLISREDAAVIICNALSFLNYSIEFNEQFNVKDRKQISDYAIKSMNFLYHYNIITSDYFGNISPKEIATYEQVLTMICKLGNKFSDFYPLPSYADACVNINQIPKRSYNELLDGYTLENISQNDYYYQSSSGKPEIKNESIYAIDMLKSPIEIEKDVHGRSKKIFYVGLVDNQGTVDLEIDQNWAGMGGKFDNILSPPIYQVDIFTKSKKVIHKTYSGMGNYIYLGKGIFRIKIQLSPPIQGMDESQTVINTEDIEKFVLYYNAKPTILILN